MVTDNDVILYLGGDLDAEEGPETVPELYDKVAQRKFKVRFPYISCRLC
jgi:hypothetical protein